MLCYIYCSVLFNSTLFCSVLLHLATLRVGLMLEHYEHVHNILVSMIVPAMLLSLLVRTSKMTDAFQSAAQFC